MDPTNAMYADDNHIVVAIGRDYADVSPIDGVSSKTSPMTASPARVACSKTSQGLESLSSDQTAMMSPYAFETMGLADRERRDLIAKPLLKRIDGAPAGAVAGNDARQREDGQVLDSPVNDLLVRLAGQV